MGHQDGLTGQGTHCVSLATSASQSHRQPTLSQSCPLNSKHMSQCVWTISCISSCLLCCFPLQMPRALALNFQGFLGLHLESHHKGAGITSTQCHVQLYVGIGNLNYLPSFVNSYAENELIIHDRPK